MRAGEIMTRPVVSVHSATSVRDAAALMTGRRITSLPVLDDDDRVVGIVSEADLIRDRMPHDPRSHLKPEAGEQPDPARTVSELMTTTVACLGEDADTADLAALMLDNNVRAVPIVDGARLVGIVSRRDLLGTLLRDDAAVQTETEQRLAEYAGRGAHWNVTVEDGVITIAGHFEDEAQEKVVALLARTVPGAVRVHTRHRRWP